MSFRLLLCAAFAAAVPHSSMEEAAQASLQSERSAALTRPQTSPSASSANPWLMAADRAVNMPDRQHEQANALTVLAAFVALRIRAHRNGAV